MAGAALDHADDLYVTGTSWSNYLSLKGTADDIVTLKFPGQGNGTPPAAAPAAPGGLVARAASKTRITLSWTDNAGNETGFRIERCSGAGCTDFTRIAQVGAGVTVLEFRFGVRRPTATACARSMPLAIPAIEYG